MESRMAIGIQVDCIFVHFLGCFRWQPADNIPAVYFLLLFRMCDLFSFPCVISPLQRKKESIATDLVLSDLLLVSVPPASSQLEVRDQLWRVHSALGQCRCLLERAIAREEQAVGVTAVGKADYQKQRKTVKDRLALLLVSTRDLLQAFSGTAGLTTTTNCQEVMGQFNRLYVSIPFI